MWLFAIYSFVAQNSIFYADMPVENYKLTHFVLTGRTRRFARLSVRPSVRLSHTDA